MLPPRLHAGPPFNIRFSKVVDWLDFAPLNFMPCGNSRALEVDSLPHKLLLSPRQHKMYLKCGTRTATSSSVRLGTPFDVFSPRRTGKGESCPEGYELIDRTPMNHNADLNHGSITSWGLHRAVHLAVRRQHVSKR